MSGAGELAMFLAIGAASVALNRMMPLLRSTRFARA
jgi:hypothetical protein